jgi:hypothetical protein
MSRLALTYFSCKFKIDKIFWEQDNGYKKLFSPHVLGGQTKWGATNVITISKCLGLFWFVAPISYRIRNISQTFMLPEYTGMGKTPKEFKPAENEQRCILSF